MTECAPITTTTDAVCVEFILACSGPGGGGGGTGDMTKAVYDTNANNIVDKSETLDDDAGNVASAAAVAGHIADVTIHVTANQRAALDASSSPGAGNPYVTASDLAGAGGGDMTKLIYDQNDSGIVDKSESVDDGVSKSASAGTVVDHLTDTSHLSTDERAAIDGSPTPPTQANPFATQADLAGAGGDMHKSTYDTNDDGIVDKAATLDDGGVGNQSTAAAVRAHLDDTTVHAPLNDGVPQAGTVWSSSKINTELGTKEPTISPKNTAFNKDFGSLAGQVAEGNHTHVEADITNLDKYTQSEVQGFLALKEDAFSKNSAFNKDFGTGIGQVAAGDHDHALTYAPLSHVSDSTLHLTANQNDALDGANNPSAGNPVATMADVSETDATNIGTGEGTIYKQKVGDTLQLKTIKAGTGVVITNNLDDVQIDATGAGGGEANTATNAGLTGIGLPLPKSGVDLPFKSIAAGDATITVSNDVVNSAVNIVVDPTQVPHQNLSGAGINDHSAIDTHLANDALHRQINDSSTATTALWSASKINTELGTKEPTISPKNTAFNKDFGTLAGTVAEGNHLHTGVYDPAGSADAVQSNLTTHINDAANPHSVTKAQVGLSQVDNTSDLDKPISTATQAALNAKPHMYIQAVDPVATASDGDFWIVTP